MPSTWECFAPCLLAGLADRSELGLLGKSRGCRSGTGVGGGFGLAAFLLALFKAQPKDLAVGDAAAEGVDGYATLAQISATVRLAEA